MHWQASAPSNIALIKYMGKCDLDRNLPANPSFSYTLDHLSSVVEMEVVDQPHDVWEPMRTTGRQPLVLSQQQQQRFLKHLQRIKDQHGYHGCFVVRSDNNFPTGTGLASSAASFAALTRCASQALGDLTGQPIPSDHELAQISRLGSGSSCRSFVGPWCVWQHEHVEAVSLPINHLQHLAILISSEPKNTSSSTAHQQVISSPLYVGRAQRAQSRLKQLLIALEHQRWREAYQITKDEFLDMHRLFTTSVPSFSYITASSQQIMTEVEQCWQQQGDGPLITMDAGPNVHLLFRDDQDHMRQHIKEQAIVRQFDVI